jgi:hypothetical protein
MREASDVMQVSAWTQGPATDLGDIAAEYRFKFQLTGEDTTTGDGTLALFGSPTYVSYMVVLNTDGQSSSDLRTLARIVSGRVDADRASSVAGR